MICVLGLNPSLKICKCHQTSTLSAIDAPCSCPLNMLDPVADEHVIYQNPWWDSFLLTASF